MKYLMAKSTLAEFVPTSPSSESRKKVHVSSEGREKDLAIPGYPRYISVVKSLAT